MKHHKEARDLLDALDRSLELAGMDFDESLQIAIDEVYTYASDDMKADLYARLMADENTVFDIVEVTKIIEAAFQ